MKLITVNRNASEADCTLSKFFSDDGLVTGVGVEDEKRDKKVKGETRIDAGLYDLGLRISPRFSKEYFRDDNGNVIHHSKRTTPNEVLICATDQRKQFLPIRFCRLLCRVNPLLISAFE